MEIFEGHRALFRPLASPAVAVGNFDGVHLGHQRLIAEAIAAAGDLGGDAVVYTFDPHPARLFAPDRAPALICTRERKLELLAACGVDVCIVEPFTRELASMGPDEFLDQVFRAVLGARCVVVGYDFTFGHQRAGTVDTLRVFGAAHGIDIRVIEPVAADAVVASSTEVRARVTAGDLRGAAALLGRDFDLDGEVVRGAGRGRELGIPTANIDFGASELIPPLGIYATWVQVLDSDRPEHRYAGATSLGTNPTFGAGGARTLEVYLLDFDGDLYGKRLRVGFIERLRGEVAFEGVDALLAEIRDDVRRTRTIFAKHSGC
ncbi:MAG TPA: bifunctional riboflavin kinase/FAD synthetase [Kofleriaceae bacterium]|nr:bifunctional riboflavin kinase/FAD synthetase [Kofleriaceae bacterium]